MNSSVAILGAGELGGAIAYTLARRGRHTDILLVDDHADVAAGKALDVRQSAPIERVDARMRGGSEALVGPAGLVVVADAIGERAAGHERIQGLLRRVLHRLGGSILVFAGATHRDLLEFAVDDLQVERRLCIGSAPLALESALRAMVGLEADRPARDVTLSVLGIPPAHLVVAWSQATISAARAEMLLDPPRLARLTTMARRLWPPGPQTLASAAAEVCEAVAIGAPRVLTGFAAVDGEFVRRPVVAALPLLVGPAGIALLPAPALSPAEALGLQNALRSAPVASRALD